jgi:hypothetical protein
LENANVPKTNAPPARASPPLNVENAKACPYPIDVAVGAVVIEGVALFTVTFTLAVVVL